MPLIKKCLFKNSEVEANTVYVYFLENFLDEVGKKTIKCLNGDIFIQSDVLSGIF